MRNNRTFIIGPGSGKITGQSHCLLALSDSLENATKISSGGEGISLFYKIYLVVKSSILLFFYSLIFRRSIVIFSISRSYGGFIKDLPIFIICIIFRHKIIAHIHGNDFYFIKDGIWKKLFDFVYKYVYLSVIPNRYMIKNLPEVLYDNYIVIENFFNFEPVKKISVNNNIKICYLSNIMRDKGIFDLLYVARLFNEKKNFNVQFEIAGNIFLSKDDYKLFFDQLSEISNVKYVGVIEENNVKDFLLRQDIFLFPSKYKTEAAPLSILEAMATSNVVAVYKHNGIENMIPKDNVIIDGYNVEALYCEIKELLSDRYKISFVKNKNYNYSFHYTRENYIQGFRDVIENI